MEEGNFLDFQTRVCNLVNVPDFNTCWEVLFDIVEGGEEDYEVDFEEIRHTGDFLLAAVLIAKFQHQRVWIIEPNIPYACISIINFKKLNLSVPSLTISTLACFDPEKADVVFHHGKRYPVVHGKDVRTIVQVFEGEQLPDDNDASDALIYTCWDKK